MKLSQDILFTRLCELTPFVFASRSTRELAVGRPLFLSSAIDCCQRAVIVSAGELELAVGFGTLFICTMPLKTAPDIEGCSILSPQECVDPGELLNALQAIFDLFEAWQAELAAICNKTGTYQDLVDSTVAVVYDPLCVVDKDLKHIAYCHTSVALGLVDEYVSEDNRITSDVFSAIITDAEFAKLYKKHTPFICTVGTAETVSLNIFYQGLFIGRAIVYCALQDAVAQNYYLALLSMLSPFADKLYAKLKATMQDQGFPGNMRHLVRDSLDGKHVAKAAWSNVLAESNWGAGDTLKLLQLRPDLRYDKNVYWKYVNEEIESSWSGCISLDYQDALVLLINLDRFVSPRGKDFAQTLPYFLRDYLLIAGLSRDFVRYQDLSQVFRQTSIALTFGALQMPTHWYHQYDNYALEYLLSSCLAELSAEHISSAKLLQLKQHDAIKQTRYYATLSAYFSCQFNAVEAAKQLLIHRSTFIARMDRIKELVAIDFEDPDELLYLQISFKLLEQDCTQPRPF